jgi:hypothetical protein
VPRLVIPVTELPPVSSSAQHVVRFRIVSEDRNRVSDWSPIFLLDSVGQIPSASTSYKLVESGSSPKLLTLTWNGGYIPTYKNLDEGYHDVFVKWDGGEFEYLGRQTGNFFSTAAKSGASTAQFLVQVGSYNSMHPPSNTPVINSELMILLTHVLNI